MKLTDSSLWQPVLAALRADLPEGAREISFSGEISPRSVSGSTTVDPPQRSGGLGDSSPDGGVFDLLTDLVEQADTRYGVLVQVPAEAPGQVTLLPRGPDQLDGLRLLDGVVLVPGALPEPYRRMPEPPSPGQAPGPQDPQAVEAFIRVCLPDAEPVPEAEIDALQAELGVPLPADVLAMWRAAGAGEMFSPSGPLDDDEAEDYDDDYGENEQFLFEIVAPAARHEWDLYQASARGAAWQYTAMETPRSGPAGALQPLAASPLWVPIGHDGGGNIFAVDLAPGPGGHVGQIVFLHHEDNAGAELVATSLSQFLAGRLTQDRHPQPDPATATVHRRTEQTLEQVPHPGLETLRVGVHSGPVSLRPIAGLPRLRTVTLADRWPTDLDVLASLPALEFLSMVPGLWLQLLDAGLVPGTLLAAGIDEDHENPGAALEVADRLLALWNRPPLPRITISESARPPTRRRGR